MAFPWHTDLSGLSIAVRVIRRLPAITAGLRDIFPANPSQARQRRLVA
ncbi:protein of unknown function [Rhodovastum atsumiense]|nr:protein of unknown function [Rhodovastum atsumiense]